MGQAEDTRCCGQPDGPGGCVFAKALVHRSSTCAQAVRHDLGERLQL